MPYRQLSSEQKALILNGDEKFIGIKRFFDHLETKKYKLYIRVFLSRYRGYTQCTECLGLRLRREARSVKIGGLAITEVTAMTVEDARTFFRELQLSPVRTVGWRKASRGNSHAPHASCTTWAWSI